MATTKFSKKLFEKEIGKLTEEMQNKIAMFGTTVESLTDDELEIDVSPNRPDLLSYQGFKQAFLGFLGKKIGLQNYKIYPPEKDYIVNIDSSVKEIRPYTACAIVKNLKFDDEKIKEIVDIQEKLHNTIGRKRKKIAIGIYPLEKITLPITLKALEPDKIKFIPLETEREMSGLQILQRHPTGRDYAHLLAGKEKFPIFIDAKNQILSMPPIINSQTTGKITETTKDVFVECSGFDFEILKKCLNIIIITLANLGGKVYSMQLTGNLKEKTPNLTPEKNKISLENTNKVLGLSLNEKQLKQLLEKMGHNYNPKNKEVESPAWRTDILHEVDLIEDVAIAYGYNNFKPEIPEIATIGEEAPKEKIKRKISNILAGLGFLETSSVHLTKKEDQIEKMGLDKDPQVIEIKESKTEYTTLRKNLTTCLLKILSENIDVEYPQSIFEMGKVFSLKNNIVEKENLAIAGTPRNFTQIKQVIEYLFRMLDLEIEIEESEKFPPEFIEGRVGFIKLKNKEIGYLGEIHPNILRNWKIKMPVSLCEIDLTEIFN